MKQWNIDGKTVSERQTHTSELEFEVQLKLEPLKRTLELIDQLDSSQESFTHCLILKTLLGKAEQDMSKLFDEVYKLHGGIQITRTCYGVDGVRPMMPIEITLDKPKEKKNGGGGVV